MEDRMNTEKKVIEIISTVLDIPESDINVEMFFSDIPEWDSLNHVHIISAIEEEFGFRFSLDMMMDIETIKDAVKIVEDNKQ